MTRLDRADGAGAEGEGAVGGSGDPPRAAPDRDVHMVGAAHLDPVWLWPWQEGYAEARATFASAIARMEEYPDFVFTCDQVVLLDWVKESDPDLFEQIRARVADGRWVNVGGWWVEPDCNIAMGESYARQGLYGQRFLAAEFGKLATVGMNVDPFGHHAMIPAILRGQGMDSYTFLRPQPHEADLYDVPFWWTSPDGSAVLAYRIPFEYGSPPGEVSGQVEKALGQLDRTYSPMMVFYGVGNHGGGPTRANLDSIARHHRTGTFGRLRTSSPRAFFDAVMARGDAEELPRCRGDLQHHAVGCYSAHSGVKAWQRRAQHAVLKAERWAIVADLLGSRANPALSYPREELGQAWKQVLFNQFHDVLPGSAIESAYDDARDQLGEAVSIAKRIIARSHNAIAAQVDIAATVGDQPVLVFNHHPWPVRAAVAMSYGGQPLGVHGGRGVTVVDEDGEEVLAQPAQSPATTGDPSRGAVLFDADLPALGYRLYRLTSARKWSQTTGSAGRTLSSVTTFAGGRGLDNGILRAEIDPSTGWLVSLLDHRTGLDVLAGAHGPHVQICADPTDTWGHGVISYARPGSEMELVSADLVEAGPLRARLRVERRWGRSTCVEELSLTAGADALELAVAIDWREPAHLMKLRFPVGVAEPEAVHEVPYATVSRPVNGAEEPVQSWVDLTGRLADSRAGLAVVVDGKHGFDTSPADDRSSPSIGLTALRSPVYAWHDPRRLDERGHYRYQDQGRQEFRCLLVPHDGDWREARLTRRSAELGAPPRAMLESSHRGSLPGRMSFLDDGGSVLVTAVKGSEDPGTDEAADGTADLVVRAVECRGESVSADIAIPVLDRTLTADFGPYQIRTFQVAVDPARPVVEVNLLEFPLP